MKHQRLIVSMWHNPSGELEAVDWDLALIAIAQALSSVPKGKLEQLLDDWTNAEALICP